jgi:hypothetical protein
MIGWFGEDAIDWVGDRLSDAGDVFSSVAGQIPFAPELAGALRDVINGPLRDFARSPVGLVVLRAMSTTIYGPLAWTIGPQVASLAFALPGLMRGDDFMRAWLTELQWRAEKTVEIGAPGVGASLTPKIQAAAAEMAKMLPAEVRGLALSELAKRLRVDQWVAAMARWLVAQIPIPPRESFDPLTGELRSVLTKEASIAERTSSSDAAAWAVRQASVAERTRSTSFIHLLDTMQPTAVAADAPVEKPRTGTMGNVALVGLIGAAGAALVWFYAGGKR